MQSFQVRYEYDSDEDCYRLNGQDVVAKLSKLQMDQKYILCSTFSCWYTQVKDYWSAKVGPFKGIQAAANVYESFNKIPNFIAMNC